MSIKDTINAQIKSATTERELIDGETITIAGTAYTGIFSEVVDEFAPQDAGTRQVERLQGVLRIDQFLDTPGDFDPAVDYSAQLPPRTGTVLLRGRSWLQFDARVAHDSWIIDLKEKRPRA